MARPSSDVLTERESQIMEILWSAGEATAERVRESLAGQPHDSTVRTLLRILKDKGYVRLVGRQPVTYRPAVSRQKVQRTATRSLLERFFGGSANELVLRLLEDEELSPQQLADLKRQRKGGRRGDDSKGNASKEVKS
jgi:predicted transcriptional regulator